MLFVMPSHGHRQIVNVGENRAEHRQPVLLDEIGHGNARDSQFIVFV